MMSQRMPLILAGAAATIVIAFGVQLTHKPNPGMPATVAVLLVVYVAGLALGRLLFGRGS
jgi:hypothetical protein